MTSSYDAGTSVEALLRSLPAAATTGMPAATTRQIGGVEDVLVLVPHARSSLPDLATDMFTASNSGRVGSTGSLRDAIQSSPQTYQLR